MRKSLKRPEEPIPRKRAPLLSSLTSSQPEKDKGNPVEQEEDRRESAVQKWEIEKLTARAPPFLTAGVQEEGDPSQGRAVASTSNFRV